MMWSPPNAVAAEKEDAPLPPPEGATIPRIVRKSSKKPVQATLTAWAQIVTEMQ